MNSPTIFIPERDAESLYLPVVITGLSGGGKSTVAAKVEASGIIPAVTYTGRLTTRGLRDDGEQEGKDGRFGVSPEEFVDNPDLFYQYEKYNTQYGFSRRALRECLAKGNTFIIGGEPNTALPIRDALNSPEEFDKADPRLKAIAVYIRRPLSEILRAIIKRGAPAEEKLTRLEHLLDQEHVRNDANGGQGQNVSYAVDYTVENGEQRLEGAVTEMISIIQGERDKQFRELFGNDFRLNDARVVS